MTETAMASHTSITDILGMPISLHFEIRQAIRKINEAKNRD